MIKVLTKEFVEGGLAVRTTEITFFSIPIFKYKKTSTNNMAIKQLTVVNKPSSIKGFT